MDVYYSSGSAGCMFTLSLALALRDTHMIPVERPIDQLVHDSWQIQSYDTWNQSEIDFVNPPKTVPDELNTISLYNNHFLLDNSHTNILCYTDIRTQYELNQLKCRRWFKDDRDPMRWPLVVAYHLAKDPSWPPVYTNEDLKRLPSWIIDELIMNYGFADPITDFTPWIEKFMSGISVDYNGMKIYRDIQDVIHEVDYAFRLQDVVKTRFKCVTDALGIEHTQEVVDHVALWLNLHPPKVKIMLCK